MPYTKTLNYPGDRGRTRNDKYDSLKEFFYDIFRKNAKAPKNKKLTDEQIADIVLEEFGRRVAYELDGVDRVRQYRGAYNLGQLHPKGKLGNAGRKTSAKYAPAKPSVPYDANGDPIPSRRGRKAIQIPTKAIKTPNRTTATKDNGNSSGPFTIPDDDDNPPRRVKYAATRTVRNTQKGLDLKSLYNSCQVCGHAIRVPDHIPRVYLEVHHLRPLGGDHKGKDNWNNMLVLCPNCHASFDFLAMAIDPQSGHVICLDPPRRRRKPTFNAPHESDLANIHYHWKRCRKWLETV